MCALGTLGCVLVVGGGGEVYLFACLPFRHALFSGGFDCCSGSCAPWLRRFDRVAGCSVVWIEIFGLGIWRGFVGLYLVVLMRCLGCVVLGR